jgi:hypothetical protein
VSADPLAQALKAYLKGEVEARVQVLQKLADRAIATLAEQLEALGARLGPLAPPPNDTATAA